MTHLAFNRSLKEPEPGADAVAKTPVQALAPADLQHEDFKKPGDIVNIKTSQQCFAEIFGFLMV